MRESGPRVVCKVLSHGECQHAKPIRNAPRSAAFFWTARLLSVSTPIILIVSLLPSSAFPQTQSEGVGISANELVRKVVANELKSQNGITNTGCIGSKKRNPGKNSPRKYSKLTMALSVDFCPSLDTRSTPHNSGKKMSACRAW